MIDRPLFFVSPTPGRSPFAERMIYLAQLLDDYGPERAAIIDCARRQRGFELMLSRIG